LFEVTAGGQRRTTVEYADVVQSKKPALESVLAGTVLPVQPPGEIEHEFLKAALEPFDISLAGLGFFQAIQKNGRPGMDRRVDIAKVPFVGGNLPVGMEV